MKILFWSDGFWPRLGGTETQGFEFVQAIQQRGHHCVVLCQKDNPDWPSREIYKGILIQRFDFDALIEKKELHELRAIREYLEWIVEEFRADVIYLNTLGNGSALPFLLFRKQLPIPAVLTVHAPHFLNGAIPPMMVQVCDAVDQICCASKWSFQVMETLLPAHRSKLQMVYCGISLPAILPKPLPFAPPILLLLGRLSSEKGFHIGIEAFSLLKNKGIDARLLIVGEGEERPYLESLIRRWQLAPFTQFTVARSRDEVDAVINTTTLTLMPSHLEGFGLVALESMRMGRPVIASKVGGLAELVAHGERGFLVPPGDPFAMCQAIEEMLKEPEVSARMGEEGRKWALERFLLNENVDRYENIFQSYCDHRRF
jgi:glycogen(starch) synthase